MLRNLDQEFRGNGRPGELYSRLVRDGAVMHMKNACSPSPEDVKILTRSIGDPGLLPALAEPPALDGVPAPRRR
jgi:hypothetical protein